jgi:SpoVK/Ycf46/Vps4 family AAA+-type ATPase
MDMSLPQAKQVFDMAPAARKICELVGMKEAKQRLFVIAISKLGIVASRVQDKPNAEDESCNFMVLGPPGVGKSSLLRAFAELLHAGGALRQPLVKIVSRVDLVGQYIGATAIKTKGVVESALGGLLVIDECYSLANTGRDIFATEAIDTLTYLMDLHKNDLMVAVAGYEKEVRENFIGGNKGLQRRFMFSIRLDPYTTSELAEIFCLECKKRGWTVTADAKCAVKKASINFKNHASDSVALASKVALVTAHRRWLNVDSETLSISHSDISGALSMFPADENEKASLECYGMYV